MSYEKPGPRISRKEALEMADGEFSLLMRAYYSVDGGVSCVTCGHGMPWRWTGEAHWGHWKPREFMATRWDVKNGGVQCAACNMFGCGEEVKMRAYLLKTYGEEEVRRIEEEHRAYVGFTVYDIVQLSQTFKAKRLEIQEEKGL